MRHMSLSVQLKVCSKNEAHVIIIQLKVCSKNCHYAVKMRHMSLSEVKMRHMYAVKMRHMSLSVQLKVCSKNEAHVIISTVDGVQ